MAEGEAEKQHCCTSMTYHVNEVCEAHPDPSDCADRILYYEPRFDEYGIIIHDGGSSVIGIEYCPWCGATLPASKRDLWIETLESLGFSEPGEQDIPAAFTSDRWYRGRSEAV